MNPLQQLVCPVLSMEAARFGSNNNDNDNDNSNNVVLDVVVVVAVLPAECEEFGV